eukprot:UN13744
MSISPLKKMYKGSKLQKNAFFTFSGGGSSSIPTINFGQKLKFFNLHKSKHFQI